MKEVLERIARITPLDTDALERARTRQGQLTKPAGSLGMLEDIAVQMAGITQHPLPRSVERKAVIVMAADHGITSEGVSAYPVAVTPQMVHNFLQGGAAINALARYVGARVIVVDVGVAADIQHPGLLSRKVTFGTANMTMGPAMSQAHMLEAIQVGMDILDAQVDEGIDLVATGDMGHHLFKRDYCCIAADTGSTSHRAWNGDQRRATCP